MRIAISGTHRVGKSTLLQELSSVLPDHAVVEEPYLQLEEEGHAFSADPSVEDFEAQLARSIADVKSVHGPALFDRCPADFLAYLACHDDGDAFHLGQWLPRARRALRTLDLIVCVGIESPDRIAVRREERAMRARVDARIKDALLDDEHELRVPVLEVTGTPQARAQRVIAWIDRRRGAVTR